MNLKYKLLYPDSKDPFRANPNDAGLDLYAHSVKLSGNVIKVGTGISIEPDPGYTVLAFPRSSIYKLGISLSNSVGVIDEGYRGEIMAMFYLPGYRYYEEVHSEKDGPHGVYQREYRTCGLTPPNINEVERLIDNLIGTRICQLVVIPTIIPNIIKSEELSHSKRGKGGFGSSGNI